ncbi:MAG TPA: PAS domain S-box protein [Hyphomicrobiaceae bacterium]|nr:PAS domain S-box protein [Hyphomicrobiaceae bacterium]
MHGPSIALSDAALVGTVVSEAIDNALFYAHPSGVIGKITVACESDAEGRTTVSVCDDGVGFPENFDPERDGGAGLAVMRALSKRLRADLTFDSSCLGLSVHLRLPAGAMNANGTKANGAAPAGISTFEEPASNVLAHTEVLEALPVAVYITDAEGRITYYNAAAADLWGYRPELGKAEYCGSWKMYRPDGTHLPHELCPMAIALREASPIRGAEAVLERPDGARVPFIPYPTPLFDAAGTFIGGINMLMDISHRKQAEAELARHRDEQSALYELTDRLFRAASQREACEAALDAISRALGCDRAAILTFDDAGVMRFIAWRGLSDGYRAAVEGHSPWTRDTKEPETIRVPDVEASDLSDELKATITAEGIGALAFIPIVVHGELVGKFMTYYSRPHLYVQQEVNLALTIARQVGFALERLRAERERQRAAEANARLGAIVESSDDAIVSKDVNGIVTSWNKGAQRVFGYTAEEMVGKSILTLIPADRYNEETEILNRIRAGQRVDHYETVRQHKDGRLIHVSLAVSPVMDSNGVVVGASKIARDITERKEAEARQEMLAREIQHRTKNLFAVVQAVITRSFAGKSSVEEAEAAVIDRLGSLAQTHALLMDTQWQGANLADVVGREMSPYAGRVQAAGPDLLLTATAAQNFSLALHELATNAVKYGALSNSTGRVSINWAIARGNGAPRFSFCWREQGGPPVSPPTRSGFGTTVLESVMSEYFDERPRINFAESGVIYDLVGDLHSVAVDDTEVAAA